MNITRGFSYVTEDPAWPRKVFIGGLVTAIPVVEAITDGFQIQTIKNIKAGHPRPLPEWDDVSAYFMRGISLRLAIYCIYIPTIITTALAVALTFAGILSWFIGDADTAGRIRLLRAAGWVVIPLIDLVVLILLPVVLLVIPALARRLADGESFFALFNPFPTLKLIFSNFGDYVLSRVSVLVMLAAASVIVLVAEAVPVLGIIIGWAVLSVARFWGRMMWAYYLAHMKR